MPLSVAGDPDLCFGELGEREDARLTGDHPREQLRRASHPVDVGDDGRPHPFLVVPDGEVQAELGVGPKRAGFDFVEVLDHIQRSQATPSLKCSPELGGEYVVVVLALNFAGCPEPDRARRHL